MPRTRAVPAQVSPEQPMQLSFFAGAAEIETPVPAPAAEIEQAGTAEAVAVGTEPESAAPASERSPLTPLPERLAAAINEYLDYLLALNRSKHTRESFALDLRLLLQYLGDCKSQQLASESCARLSVMYGPSGQQRHLGATQGQPA